MCFFISCLIIPKCWRDGCERKSACVCTYMWLFDTTYSEAHSMSLYIAFRLPLVYFTLFSSQLRTHHCIALLTTDLSQHKAEFKKKKSVQVTKSNWFDTLHWSTKWWLKSDLLIKGYFPVRSEELLVSAFNNRNNTSLSPTIWTKPTV